MRPRRLNNGASAGGQRGGHLGCRGGFCRSCRHEADADLHALIDAGRGDVPLIQLRWRCSQCRSARIDMICTSHARVQPAPSQRQAVST